MKPEQARALREPFAPELIGKLPRVWCGDCRNSRYKVCDKHARTKCRDCGGNLTNAHLHLDYVGHAEITDRLLTVDPEWVWEPVAFDPDSGLPKFDQAGGLWIRLTVAGVTRLGYGHADGKTGPDAVKEAIGDALRNAAMRFGVALDLWGAKFKEHDEPEPAGQEQQPRQGSPRPALSARARELFTAISNAQTAVALKAVYDEIGPALAQEQINTAEADQLAAHVRSRKAELEAAPAPVGEVAMVNQQQHREMHALWRELGLDGEANREKRLARTEQILGLNEPLESSANLTFAQARTVIEGLRNVVKAQRSQAGSSR